MHIIQVDMYIIQVDMTVLHQTAVLILLVLLVLVNQDPVPHRMVTHHQVD